MNAYERYMYITETNDAVTSFRSNREKAQYHYFNQNGAYARHTRMMKTLKQAVEADLINSGWLISNDANYYYRMISKSAMQKRVNRHEVNHAVNMFNETTERAYTRLAEVILEIRDRAGHEIDVPGNDYTNEFNQEI